MSEAADAPAAFSTDPPEQHVIVLAVRGQTYVRLAQWRMGPTVVLVDGGKADVRRSAALVQRLAKQLLETKEDGA